jgi:hypothetical protein
MWYIVWVLIIVFVANVYTIRQRWRAWEDFTPSM